MATTNFFWDEFSDNLLMETDENNVPTAVYTHRPERFGQLISQERSGTTSYFIYDGENSTRMLTDDNQTITDTYIYSGFGELVARTGTTTNPFGYKGAVGYYTNSATNDIYVRARTYQPVTGRWLSMDPFGFVDGPNLYRAYFAPDGIDPVGLACSPPAGYGIHYVPGRGHGTIIGGDTLDPRNPYGTPGDTFWVVNGMWVDYTFHSVAGAFEPGNCDCCCDQIGFVQIVKSSVSVGLLGMFQREHNWIVDGGIPYPVGDPKTDYPCPGPAKIRMFDEPTRSTLGLREWEFHAEVCAACIKGKEGPRHFHDETPESITTQVGIGLVAYECAEWSFRVKYDRKNHKYIRTWIKAPRIIGAPNTDAWNRALIWIDAPLGGVG